MDIDQRRPPMSTELTFTSVKEILRFPFRDANWRNRFAIGAALILASVLLCYIPFFPFFGVIPSLFVAGYVYRVQRRAAKSGELVLPPWDDWGGLALDGLKGLLVRLVYTLPALLCFVGGMFLYYVLIFGMTIPMAFLEDSGGAIMLMLLMMFGSMALMFLAMFVGWALLLLGMVPLPMAMTHFVARDELAAGFRLREIWSLIKADKLGYFVAYVVVAGLGMMLYIGFILLYMSMVLCALLPFVAAPAAFYIMLISAAVFGLTYKENAALIEAGE
jgi:hypothetical protein